MANRYMSTAAILRCQIEAHLANQIPSAALTLWTFRQNVAQLQIDGTQAPTLVDNAGVIQVFGTKNLRMAPDLVNIVGGVSAEKTWD